MPSGTIRGAKDSAAPRSSSARTARFTRRAVPLPQSGDAAHRRGVDAAAQPVPRLEGAVRPVHPDDAAQQLGHRGPAQQSRAARAADLAAASSAGSSCRISAPRSAAWAAAPDLESLEVGPRALPARRSSSRTWTAATLQLAHDGFDPDIERVPLEHARWFAGLAVAATRAAAAPRVRGGRRDAGGDRRLQRRRCWRRSLQLRRRSVEAVATTDR